MNATLAKAVMTRSRLRNKYLKNTTMENRLIFTRYRNYCTHLFRSEKKRYYEKLNQKIILVEDELIISNDKIIAETFNNFFVNAVSNLKIIGPDNQIYGDNGIDITKIICKFKNHREGQGKC